LHVKWKTEKQKEAVRRAKARHTAISRHEKAVSPKKRHAELHVRQIVPKEMMMKSSIIKMEANPPERVELQ